MTNIYDLNPEEKSKIVCKNYPAEKIGSNMEKKEIQLQIELMIKYAQMMLYRQDFHGLWDAAIDLQRLTDKLEFYKNATIDREPLAPL
jgi:hypothetical protein